MLDAPAPVSPFPAGDPSDGRRHPSDAEIDAGKGVPQVLQQGRSAQVSETPAVRGAVPEHLREGFPGDFGWRRALLMLAFPRVHEKKKKKKRQQWGGSCTPGTIYEVALVFLFVFCLLRLVFVWNTPLCAMVSGDKNVVNHCNNATVAASLRTGVGSFCSCSLLSLLRRPPALVHDVRSRHCLPGRGLRTITFF